MKKKKKPKIKLNDLVQGFEMALSLGFSLSLPLVIGVLLGTFLDKTTKLQPLFTLFFLLLGLVLSFFCILRIIKDNLKTYG